jgi:hypothetical protein
VGAGNQYSSEFSRRILEFGKRIRVEALMRILVSAAQMMRLVVLCFVLGIALGVYFGVAGSPEAVPPVVDHSVAPVNATAP